MVCSCNVFSDGDVRSCMNSGPDCPRTPARVYRHLGCGPQCGRCATTTRAIMDQTPAQKHACSADCASACPPTQQANSNEAPKPMRWQHKIISRRNRHARTLETFARPD
ncbi:MAG TPA: (2Fe-2S)-binding protein [Microvirga sp.]|nr:(2Fe-2S)-binding protein [Microvirga sp.]